MAQPTTMATPTPIAGTKRKREPKHYAVKEGKKPGVYETWEECLQQVKGHKGALFKAFQSLHEAKAFVDGVQLKETTARQSAEQKFYAVQNGHHPGVYTDWSSVQKEISGFKNPKHRKFNTRAEAEEFVAAGRKPSYENFENLSPQEQIRRIIVQHSAPGLYMNSDHPPAPKDKDGNEYEIGRGPPPPGAEDGFDPNLKLTEDGTIIRKTDVEKFKTKLLSKEKEKPGLLRIYTDGSSLRNGQAGARAGVGVFFGPMDQRNVSEPLRGSKQTNQRAELTAILRALEIAPRHRDVEIYTDSKYAISCVTEWYKAWVKNDWKNSKGKPVENKDLVVEIRERIEERDAGKKRTGFVWVKGHNGDEGNVAADRLAVDGAMGSRARSVESGSGSGEVVMGEGDAEGDEEQEVKDAYRAMEEAMAEDDKSEIE